MSVNLINTTLIILFLGLFKVLGVFVVFKYLFVWVQANVFGHRISIFNIIKIGLRKIPPKIIINALIMAHKAGLKNITSSDLENHHLAGGKVNNVIRALIEANNANLSLDLKQAMMLDLAEIDIFEAVKTSIKPKVVDCPSNDTYISAVTKDGIELKIKAKVTVKTLLHLLPGSGKEETLIANISEVIMSTVSSFENYQIALESLQKISEIALRKKLNYQTALEVLSIDIVSITLGSDIGAKIKAEQTYSSKLKLRGSNDNTLKRQ